MAKITFSVEELVAILASNKILPVEIIRPKVEGETIHFIIRTGLFILPFVPVTLRYLNFEDGHAFFELAIVSGHLDKLMKQFEGSFTPKLPAYIRLEYPKISVDIGRLLEENNIRGIRVSNISFEQGSFTIETCNI